MGLLVCKVGTTAAATGGETIFVPATQQAYAAPGAQYLPGLGTNNVATAGSATLPMNNRAGAIACAASDPTTAGTGHTPMRLMFGTDKNMFNMLQISTGDVAFLDTITMT